MTDSPLDDLFGASGGGDFLDNEGTFEFAIEKAEAKNSKNGKAQIKLNMKVFGGPDDGKTLIHTLTYSPESEVALSIFARSLAAFGADQEFAKQVASQLPQGAQIATLVSEAAKIAPGKHVLATVALDKDNSNIEYRDRVKVQYDLKKLKTTTTPAPAPVPSVSADAIVAAAPSTDAPPF